MPFAHRAWLLALALGAGTGWAGTPWLGQPAPGREPRLFAAELLDRGLPARDITFAPDGSECHVRVDLPGGRRAVILGVRRQGQGWSAPEVPAFAADPRWQTMEPCITPDGARFLFVTDRPADPQASQPGPFGIWMMARDPQGGWTQPRRLPEAINGPDGTFFPSATRGGTLYFAKEGPEGLGIVCRSRWTGTEYGPVETLPPVVQCGTARFNPLVAPDESWVILAVQGLNPGKRGLDLAILFRDAQDRWSAPQRLEGVNDALDNVSAALSPDGRFLFFSSRRTVVPLVAPGERLTLRALEDRGRRWGGNGLSALYWVDAGLLEDLRGRAVFSAARRP